MDFLLWQEEFSILKNASLPILHCIPSLSPSLSKYFLQFLPGFCYTTMPQILYVVYSRREFWVPEPATKMLKKFEAKVGKIGSFQNVKDANRYAGKVFERSPLTTAIVSEHQVWDHIEKCGCTAYTQMIPVMTKQGRVEVTLFVQEEILYEDSQDSTFLPPSWIALNPRKPNRGLNCRGSQALIPPAGAAVTLNSEDLVPRQNNYVSSIEDRVMSDHWSSGDGLLPQRPPLRINSSSGTSGLELSDSRQNTHPRTSDSEKSDSCFPDPGLWQSEEADFQELFLDHLSTAAPSIDSIAMDVCLDCLE